ncbi:dipeptidase [Brachybacterium sp. p3-SID1565]|uniref:M15 family metallopeptidase n=1 Tax=unclassified Brachybacterium TaxID=2623841 RepID=UPI0021AA88C2|nr:MULTISPECIES: M15 family metallopeptidase [unclassified Brachybacterium]MCT1384770.1 dipeptidase [Brachybacterium sp. p3-SID1565]MCT1774870.1 dipeptidase [Brachybacterium sp. p3-SID957]
MLLLSDPRLLEIPVEDTGEPLIDLTDVSDLRIDDRKADPEGAWRRLRRKVAERLLIARRALPDRFDLLFIEGYRPAGLQSQYFSEYLSHLMAQDPGLSEHAARIEASKYISPVEVAPHPCGAAVDLTLTENGIEVDMGTPVNQTPEDSAGACVMSAENISPGTRRARQILTEAMDAAGFVNYEPEWWHWSYGDRIWAARTDAPSALYAPL